MGNTKTTETAILSLCVGIASGLAAYYERQKDKESRETAKALDEIQVRTFLTWAGLI